MPRINYKHSEETKEKIRRSHLGKKLSPEHAEKTRKANLGRKFTEEHKRKIGISHKGLKPSKETIKKLKDFANKPENILKSINNLPKNICGKNNGNWKGGISRNQRLEILAGRKKPEKCELCGREGSICFDHDHKTGKFRGWICKKCNGALGMVDDNIQTLLLMIEYLNNNI